MCQTRSDRNGTCSLARVQSIIAPPSAIGKVVQAGLDSRCHVDPCCLPLIHETVSGTEAEEMGVSICWAVFESHQLEQTTGGLCTHLHCCWASFQNFCFFGSVHSSWGLRQKTPVFATILFGLERHLSKAPQVFKLQWHPSLMSQRQMGALFFGAGGAGGVDVKSLRADLGFPPPSPGFIFLHGQ